AIPGEVSIIYCNKLKIKSSIHSSLKIAYLGHLAVSCARIIFHYLAQPSYLSALDNSPGIAVLRRPRQVLGV
ncbi:MAG: hypothetical protein WAQ98_00240, partial [Blastocatellia bacterium]